MSRTLVIARHAQAEAYAPTDADRELTAAGREDAGAAGRWLAACGVVPDLALVSDAVRTQQTFAAMRRAAGWAADATSEPGLYSATPETLLDVLRGVEDEVRTLLVVGHNPTAAYLAQLLDDGTGDDEASTAMAAGFPTGALAVFEYAGDWSDLDLGRTRLVGFHDGRGVE